MGRAFHKSVRAESAMDRLIAKHPPEIEWVKTRGGIWVHTSINDPHAERGIPERCKRDHEFTPENTIWRSDGSRMCRECKRQRERDHLARKKNQCMNETLLAAARTEL